MQTKRQFLLPLLAAATAMMVSPYANATPITYDYPTSVGGSTAYTAGTTLNDGDVLNVDSGNLYFATTTTTAGSTINIKAGATVSSAAATYSTGAGNTAALTINVNGTLTGGANQAVNALLWNSTGAVNITVAAGGVMTGDVVSTTVAANSNNSAINLTVNGTWTGDFPASTTTTGAATIIVSGPNAVINKRLNGIATPTAATSTIKMNQGATINSNIAVTTVADALTLDVDTGSSVITGNISGGAAGASILNLGSVDTANSASLTVNGTFDSLQITQAVPGTLIFNGAVGSNNATGAMVLSMGNTQFLSTAVTGAATFDGSNVTTFASNYTSAAMTVLGSSNVTVNGNLSTGGSALAVKGAGQLTVKGSTSVSTFTTSSSMYASPAFPGSTSTFTGTFTASGAVDMGANTTQAFNGGYSQGAASLNAGKTTILSSAVLTGGITNTGSLVFGAATGSPAVALSAAGITNTSGTTTLNSGVTLSNAVTLTATSGIIVVGNNIALSAAATAGGAAGTLPGLLDLYPGVSNTAAITNNATGVVKIRGAMSSTAPTQPLQVTISGNNYAPTGETVLQFDNSAQYGQLNVTGGNAAFGTNNGAVTLYHTGGYVAPGAYQMVVTNGTLTAGTGNKNINSPSQLSGSVVFTMDFGVTTANVVTVTAKRIRGLNTYASEANAQGLLSSINSVPVATFQNASLGQRTVLNAIESFVAANYTNPGAINTAMQTYMPNVSSIAASRRILQTAATTLAARLESVAYNMDAPLAYVAGHNHGSSIWMRGTYTNANQNVNSSTNYNGYTSNQYGAMIGFDTSRFAHSTLGLALGYNQTKSKDRLNLASINTVKAYQIMPYGSFNLGDRSTRGFIDWFAGYVYNSVSGVRVVGSNLGVNNYSYNASIFSAKGTYGLDRVINRNLTLTPFVSMLMSYQPSASYNETGYAQYAIQNNSNFGLEFELGVKGIVRPDCASKANTRIILRAMGVWSALNNNLKSTGTLIGTQSFTYSVTQQKFGARAGVSGVFEVLNDLDLELSYDVEARSRYFSQTGLVEFKYHF
jgi:hypothetical protein